MNQLRILTLTSALLAPSPLFAASIQTAMIDFVDLVNGTLIPLLFSLAFLFFFWHAFQFFILQSNNDEGKAKAKQLMIYGLTAMVLAVSVWGVVKLGSRALGIDRQSYICPDYMPNCHGTSRSYYEPSNTY